MWPSSGKGYRPNRYGYGGLDPAGGERKGGNGRGIPREVSVGWWNGNIVYPVRQFAGKIDTQPRPSGPVITEVGWWGD